MTKPTYHSVNVDGLDEMSRALVLFYLEGFDHSEIAELLGTTASNVGTRLNRIRAKLQSQAKEYIHGPR